MNKKTPYPINESQTHYEGCFLDRHHHNCALAELDRVTQERDELQAKVVVMGEALKNCADDLEAEINDRYGESKSHPAMESRYQRDMRTVHAAKYAATNLPQRVKVLQEVIRLAEQVTDAPWGSLTEAAILGDLMDAVRAYREGK